MVRLNRKSQILSGALALLFDSFAILMLSWLILVLLWPIMAALWPILAPSWPIWDATCRQLGTSWRPRRAIGCLLAANLVHLGGQDGARNPPGGVQNRENTELGSEDGSEIDLGSILDGFRMDFLNGFINSE